MARKKGMVTPGHPTTQTHSRSKPRKEHKMEDNDVDQNNPGNLTADEWQEIYGNMNDFEGFLDHDHSMDH